MAGLLYADIFSLDFLTPLSDSDTQFKLEPHPQIELSRYTEMVKNTSDIMGANAPDLLGNVYTPRGNIQVQSPYLEVSAFNPRSRLLMHPRKIEKRKLVYTKKCQISIIITIIGKRQIKNGIKLSDFS